MGIQPIGDRVLVEALQAEQVTKSGIVIPDTAQEKQQKGKVIAVGTGRILDNGEKKALSIKKNDLVVFARYSGTEIKFEGKEYLILKEDDILAVLEQ